MLRSIRPSPIFGRTPLPLLTPPPDLWGKLWATEGAVAEAIRSEIARAGLEPAARPDQASGRHSSLEASACEQRGRLIAAVRAALRTRHYSPRTERAYVGWIGRFFGSLSRDLSPHKAECFHVERFLTHLATRDRVSTTCSAWRHP